MELVFFFLLFFVLPVGGLIAIVVRFMFYRRSPEGNAAKKRLARRKELGEERLARRKELGEGGFLSSLPTIYYSLAIFCGIVLLLATVSTAQKSSDTETGAMIGYTVGAVLSMLAVGRVIQLLQKSHAALNTLIEIEKFKLKRADSNAPVE